MSMKNHESHVLWVSAVEGAPPGILDKNGAVVLNMCRHCGKAEAELVDPCEKVPQEEEDDLKGFKTLEEGWKIVMEGCPSADPKLISVFRAMFYAGAMWGVKSPSIYANVHYETKLYMQQEKRKMLEDIFGIKLN